MTKPSPQSIGLFPQLDSEDRETFCSGVFNSQTIKHGIEFDIENRNCQYAGLTSLNDPADPRIRTAN